MSTGTVVILVLVVAAVVTVMVLIGRRHRASARPTSIIDYGATLPKAGDNGDDDSDGDGDGNGD